MARKAVERDDLQIGDLIWTHDGLAQLISWKPGRGLYRTAIVQPSDHSATRELPFTRGDTILVDPERHAQLVARREPGRGQELALSLYREPGSWQDTIHRERNGT